MNQPPGGPPGGGYPPPGGGNYGPAPGGAYGTMPGDGGPPAGGSAPTAAGEAPGGGYGPPPGPYPTQTGGGYGPPPDGFGGPPPGGYGGGPPPDGFGGGGYGPPPGPYGAPPPGGGGYDAPPGGGYPPGGYPPGGYPPGYPPMAPMPPSPPQKRGMSGAMIALIVLVVLTVLGGSCTACWCFGLRAATRSSKAPAVTTADPAPKPVKAAPTAVANDNWITADRPFVKFLAPAGWTTQITADKDWGIFKSPKRDAVFAFTTFSRPGESTVRLGKAASVLGVTDINWNAPRYSAVGKDKFDAHVADGSCNFEGPGGYIWYATVNTGSSDQILLIFTVASNAPKQRRVEAQGALDTLQRR
jgi:hypothetical protein